MQISLSLVSHTNAGKTTLARTLLGKDVGVIRDESHVTEQAEAHEMIRTENGDVLTLWDTPGFGDSIRLARRLSKSDSPLNWMVEQVWDRLADRPLFSSQQALTNVREQADVVLYLVNAAEDPDSAGYVAPEMSILAWVGKPVIALLNQMGPPRTREQEQAEIDLWRDRLAQYPAVRQVMALDAFARCWVQERVLLGAIGPLVTLEKQSVYDQLFQAWLGKREDIFEQASQVLAENLARTALDVETLPDTGLTGRLREFGSSLGVGSKEANAGRNQAMVDLAQRWGVRDRAATDQLISLHQLEGSATAEVMTRVDANYAISEKLSEGKAALVGGVTTGALAGLKADLATGGLTLGGGMLAGSVLGALGAAGLARGYNMIRGQDQIIIQWSDAVMINKVVNAMLVYLAVTHFGRGRGDWARAEYPEHWLETVNQAVQKRRPEILKCWKPRTSQSDAGARQALIQTVSDDLSPIIRSALLEVLMDLYPQAFGLSKRPISAAEKTATD